MGRTDNTQKLVRIVPVETNREHKDALGEKKVMQREWQPDKFGRFFPDNLAIEKIKPVLVKARVKMEFLFLQKDGDFLVYQYKGRPLIKLNLKDGHFYAPAAEIEEFTREGVQQQAHMLLDNLKKANLTGAVIGKPVYPSSARQVLGQLKTYKKEP
jgi:hypothetical protein